MNHFKKHKAFWLALLLAGAWACAVAYAWSPRWYWPDADGYMLHVAEGRWVAHPPGYAFFVILGRGMHLVGLSPYVSVQAASLLLTMAGLVVLFFLVRRFVTPVRAVLLTAVAGFSWIVLLNAQTGTSHAADLFSVSLLLWAAVRLPGNAGGSAWRKDAVFGLALVLCAGFRLTTLVMMLPLCIAVAVFNMRRASFWVCSVAAGVAAGAVQAWVIGQSGGFESYSAYSAAMHAGNSQASLILNGVTPSTTMNAARALLWFCLGCLAFAPLVFSARERLFTKASLPALIYGFMAVLGPLAGVVAYLCTHPGYLVATVPGCVLCAAVADNPKSARLPKATIFAIVTGVLAFLFMRPFEQPLTKWQAVANGILLQYAAPSSRAAVFKTTARWLEDAGFGNVLPVGRIRDLREEDAWRRHVEDLESQ